MSGGSMDYLSIRVADVPMKAHTPERRAFREHLQLVARALYIIEWNDSGDGAEGETDAIRACLKKGEVLRVLVSEAKEKIAELQLEINRTKEEKK